MVMSIVVEVRFRNSCRPFDYWSERTDFRYGDQCLVEKEGEIAVAKVVAAGRKTFTPDLKHILKPVIRKLDPEDNERVTRNALLENEAFQYYTERIQARQLPMKPIRVEYAFDGQKATFYFSAEGRVDFRDLVKDLAARFRLRVEMRQVGARDEAKMICGMGICGRELCCSTFLTCFAPISIKMAKEQGLALNPSKISGLCGRLRCCLSYEYETYRAISTKLPKLGKRITTPEGVGKVVKLETLKEKVTVELEDGRRLSFQAAELDGTPA